MQPAPSPRRPGELVFAAIVLVFAVCAFWQSYGISGFSGKTTAGVFPMLASGVMVLSGVVILISAARKPASSGGFWPQILPLPHLVLIGLVCAYTALMPLLGFLVSSALFLFCTFQFLWRKNPFLTLALTALVLGSVYVLFRQVFQVVLPEGTLLQGLF